MNSRIFALSILLTLCHSKIGFAQSGEFEFINMSRIGQVLHPSPDAASLGRFGGIPLNLSSGSPNVSIPLYSLKTSNIEVPISVQYSTNGYVVDELASRVGLSWTLNCGGVITRTVYDGPDETSQVLPIPPGFNSGTSSDEIYDYLYYNNQSVYDLQDVQPDIFTYNFGSYQGKFILKNGQVVMLDNNNMAVRTALIEPTLIEGFHFKIKTPDGIVYFFGGVNGYESSGTLSQGTNCGGDTDFPMTETAWYLRKIIHPSGDVIEFVYSAVSQNFPISISQTQSRMIRLSNISPGGCISETEPYQFEDQATNSTCVVTQYSFGIRLDQIITSDGQKISLSYRSRQDLPQDFLVDKIKVHHFNSQQIWKNYNFSYLEVQTTGFTNSWNFGQTALNVKPFLVEVSETSTQSAVAKTYKFDYTDLINLPARLSYSQDYWGYFNGENNNTLLYLNTPSINSTNTLVSLFDATADRTPNSSFSQKGLLKAVTYPTGGYDELFYEGHVYKADETIYLQDPRLATAIANNQQSPVNPVVGESATFTPNKNQSAALMVTSNYYGSGGYDPPGQRVEYSLYDVTSQATVFSGQDVVAGNGVPNEITSQVSLFAGHTYKVVLKSYGVEVIGNAELSYYEETPQHFVGNKPVGGVRLSKFFTKTNISATPIVKKFYYAFKNDLNSSSCDNITYQFDNLSKSVRTAVCTFTADCRFAKAAFYDLSSSTYFNISRFSGKNIAYRCVLESSGEDFEGGYVENIFNFAPDFLPVTRYGNNPLQTPFSSGEHLQSLPLLKTEYKRVGSAFVKVSSEAFAYTSDTRGQADFPAYTIRCNYTTPCSKSTLLSIDDVVIFDVREYQVSKRWVYPSTVTKRMYSSNDETKFNEEIITYIHEDVGDISPSKISTTNSKGDQIHMEVIAARKLFALSQPQWLENLKQKGCVDCPIEQIQIKTIGAIDFVVGAQLLIYDETILKPKEIYKLEISAPIPFSQFVLSKVEAGQFVYDNRYKKFEEFSYYSNGNLKTSLNNSGVVSVYFWGYAGKYPVAKIVNATYLTSASYISQSVLDNPVDDATLRSHLNSLRNIPGAHVATYTYSPLIGVTSETNLNGRTTYYTYDGFGRLSLIKDHEGNIIKKFCYSYAGQSEECQ